MLSIIKKQNGFSLIELVIAIVITGIFASVIIGIVGQHSQSFAKIFNQSVIMSEGRKAMNRLRIDLQNLSPDSISIMHPDLLKFNDINGNTITYNYSQDKLSRNDKVIANFLQSATFTYLDKSKNETDDSQNLCYIKVNLIFKRNQETFKIEELIYARN